MDYPLSHGTSASCSARRLGLLGLMALCLLPSVGCRHREQVKEVLRQREELKRLNAEQDDLAEQLKVFPRDQPRTLVVDRARIKKQGDELAALEPEVASSAKRRDDVAQAFATYRSLHPMKTP